MSNFRQRPGPTAEEIAEMKSGSQYGTVLWDIHYGGLSQPGSGSLDIVKAEVKPQGTVDSISFPLIVAAILLFFVMK